MPDKITGYIMGIPCNIPYKGWNIWGWTGWKGTKTTITQPTTNICTKCSKPLVGTIKSMPGLWVHWSCIHPTPTLDKLAGQWLAVLHPHEQEPVRKFLATQCSRGWAAMQDGFYVRGQDFDNVPERIELSDITEESNEDDKEAACRDGLVRMFRLIDSIQPGALYQT